MRIIVTILFFVFLGFSSEAQIKFYKVYSDNGNDFGESIVQLADSSYTVVGRSSSFGYGPSQAFMMHLDSLGNREWAKSFGGLETDGAKKVLHIENKGYWVSGFTNSFGGNDYDFYCLKRMNQESWSGRRITEEQVGKECMMLLLPKTQIL